MPCNTITKVTLELKNANLELLKKALETFGYKVQQAGETLSFNDGEYSQKTGEFKLFRGKEDLGNRIKQVYTSQLVQDKASRFGWKIRDTGQYKFQIIKS